MSNISSLSGNSFWLGLGKEFYISFPTLKAPCIQITNPQNLEINQDSLVEKLLPLASKAFSVEVSTEFRADVRAHVLGSQNLLVVFDPKTAEPIAFRVWDNIDLGNVGSVSYLSGICVLPEYQGKNFGGKLIQYVHKEGSRLNPKTLFMILRTQNPRMQRCFLTALKNYPGEVYLFGDSQVPLNARFALAATALHIQDSSIDLEKLVSRKIYPGGSLYGKSYNVAKESRGTNFENLDQNAGDSAYCIWKSS